MKACYCVAIESPIQTRDHILMTTCIYFEAGLTGQGQVAAIGDTGVDWKSCYFYDPGVPLPVNPTNTSSPHRKFVGYLLVDGSDTVDEPYGHGTHTVTFWFVL
jgi:hypothetical protein